MHSTTNQPPRVGDRRGPILNRSSAIEVGADQLLAEPGDLLLRQAQGEAPRAARSADPSRHRNQSGASDVPKRRGRPPAAIVARMSPPKTPTTMKGNTDD